MPAPGQRQSGEGRLSFLIVLALFGAGVFVAVKIVPVRIDAYQFRETLRDEARYASVHPNDRDVRERILDKAQALDIPLQPDGLDISRTKTEVIIKASYEKPVDLKLTTFTYRFSAEQRAPLF
jgi:hypothetical protein